MKCREAERGLEEREPWRSGAEGRAASQTTAAAGFSSSLLVSGSVAISPGRRGVVDPCKCETKNFLPERKSCCSREGEEHIPVFLDRYPTRRCPLGEDRKLRNREKMFVALTLSKREHPRAQGISVSKALRLAFS
ncbi:uncharacterized protein LOC144284990 isoform X1 [Canis aureus]